MTASSSCPARGEDDLRQRQRRGSLRVRTAREFRERVRRDGLAAAYRDTDVVVAANAEFIDQASLHLGLGPADPPIRLRTVQLGEVSAQAVGAGGDLVLPIGGGLSEGCRRSGAQVLADLLAGRAVDLSASGEGTALQPRRELHTRLDLGRIGSGRLLLHRGIGENGIVALSSAEGVLPGPCGPLLGPFANALHTCSGADSIGLAMPRLSLLGPGSPVLVAGAIGWVVGTGSGHQPNPRRLPSGHARSPGAVAAVCVDIRDLQPEWVRACWFEGHGSALLVGIAAPIPLIDLEVARGASLGNESLEAPVLDVSIPRRIKPSFGGVAYATLLDGRIEVDGHRVAAAPAHSPRLADSIAADLVARLRDGRFPLRLPTVPLSARATLLPIDP
jgi:uncharacterized protein (DUF39 family)